MRFTDEQIKLASTKSIAAFLEEKGEKVRLNEETGEINWNRRNISITGNVYYDWSKRKGGNVIGFLQDYFNMSFKEAVEELLDEKYPSDVFVKKKEILTIPRFDENTDKIKRILVDGYQLNESVVKTFIEKEMLYQSTKGLPVFLGYNNGKLAFAVKIDKGQEIVCKGSDYKWPVIWEGNEKIFIFKSPIEMLSFISLYPKNWKFNSYVATCSFSQKGVLEFVKRQKGQVYLCFNKTVEEERMARFLNKELKKDRCKIVKPENFSWNEELKAELREREYYGSDSEQ